MPESDLALLGFAVNAMDEGVGVFSSDDLLVAHNARFATVQRSIGGDVQLGIRWQDLVAAGLRQGKIPEARGREVSWLEQRCQLRGAYAATRQTPDGYAYRVNERRMPNGGIVAVWTDVTELVLREQAASVPATRAGARLTDRQREVLMLLARGLSMKAVARTLCIAPRTVAFHKYQAMEANRLSSDADLLRFALEQGLVSTAIRGEAVVPPW